MAVETLLVKAANKLLKEASCRAHKSFELICERDAELVSGVFVHILRSRAWKVMMMQFKLSVGFFFVCGLAASGVPPQFNADQIAQMNSDRGRYFQDSVSKNVGNDAGKKNQPVVGNQGGK
jgi:hypothetical protein